mgnify:CR=1 FL=1
MKRIWQLVIILPIVIGVIIGIVIAISNQVNMNREKLERANALTRAIDVLDDLNRVMCVPYPQFSNKDKQVNSACLDEETLKRLVHVI